MDMTDRAALAAIGGASVASAGLGSVTVATIVSTAPAWGPLVGWNRVDVGNGNRDRSSGRWRRGSSGRCHLGRVQFLQSHAEN